VGSNPTGPAFFSSLFFKSEPSNFLIASSKAISHTLETFKPNFFAFFYQIFFKVKGCQLKPIEGSLNRLVKYYVEYAARTGLKPLSLETLRTKPEYKDLYGIISEALATVSK